MAIYIKTTAADKIDVQRLDHGAPVGHVRLTQGVAGPGCTRGTRGSRNSETHSPCGPRASHHALFSECVSMRSPGADGTATQPRPSDSTALHVYNQV